MASLPVPGKEEFPSASAAYERAQQQEYNKDLEIHNKILKTILNDMDNGRYSSTIDGHFPLMTRDFLDKKGYIIKERYWDGFSWWTVHWSST